MPPPGCISLSDSALNVGAQYFAPAPQCPLRQVHTPTPTGAVFFRRSRLFFREAAFFSGGEGCEWGAKQPTVGESGDKAGNEFSGFIPLVVPRKGFSPHIPASRLFYLLHPTKSTQKSKIQINPSPNPYIYNVYPPPPKKSKKHLPISKKSTNFALAKSQTAHLQPSQSRAKAHQKPNCKNFFKKKR